MSELKCMVLRENLQKALSCAGRVISTRSSLPVLSNILISSEGGRLKISATDLETGVNYFIGAKIDSQGAITVPARIFMDFVMQNPDEKISLVVKDSSLDCSSDHHKATIKGIPAEEFPDIPKIREEALVKIEAEKIKEAIPQVVFAAAQDESRPVLSGVLLKFKGKELKMVATDSYRLAEKSLVLEKAVKDEKVVVPAKALNELLRISSALEGEIEIKVSENQILFSVGDEAQLISRLIEGQFPNYEQVIPEKSETEGVFATSDFSAAVKLAAAFARESANSMKLSFLPEKNELKIAANSAAVGENISTVEGKVEGVSNEINFNAKYVLDALGNLSSQNVKVSIAGSLSPGVIRPEGVEDYLYIVMPLRV
jgi:DNA polymerase-3 subunit beta